MDGNQQYVNVLWLELNGALCCQSNVRFIVCWICRVGETGIFVPRDEVSACICSMGE